MQTHCNVNIVLEIFIESENGDVIPVTSICILFHLRFKKKLSTFFYFVKYLHKEIDDFNSIPQMMLVYDYFSSIE